VPGMLDEAGLADRTWQSQSEGIPAPPEKLSLISKWSNYLMFRKCQTFQQKKSS